MMQLAPRSRSRPMPGSWSLPKPLPFAFSCVPPPKGTTCRLNRLLRHGSHGRPYIACDAKVSRKNDVALLLQDVSVLMQDFEPTPRHFLRRMVRYSDVHGRFTPLSPRPCSLSPTWLTALSSWGSFGQTAGARARSPLRSHVIALPAAAGRTHVGTGG